jgi:hypothetical protein
MNPQGSLWPWPCSAGSGQAILEEYVPGSYCVVRDMSKDREAPRGSVGEGEGQELEFPDPVDTRFRFLELVLSLASGASSDCKSGGPGRKTRSHFAEALLTCFPNILLVSRHLHARGCPAVRQPEVARVMSSASPREKCLS